MLNKNLEGKDIQLLRFSAHQDIRRRGINAVLAGEKQIEAAKALGVTRQAVSKWMKAYREEGERVLKPKRKGRPKGLFLPTIRAGKIAELIMDYYPEQLNLPFYLWTREAVARLIEQRFGISFSTETVGRYLKRWGFTHRKSLYRLSEKNTEALYRWFEKKYPSILKQGRREKAEIFWFNATRLQPYGAMARSFGVGSQIAGVFGGKQQFSRWLVSILSNRRQLIFKVYKNRFCSDVFDNFISRLLLQVGRNVFLLIQGQPIDGTSEIKAQLGRSIHRIRVFFLPGDGLEMNLDDLFNHDLNSHVLGRLHDKVDELIAAGG